MMAGDEAGMRVGVIGLGAMGSRIAARLLDAGHRVGGWNRTAGRASALDAAGLERFSTPAELAAASDVVILMLWDSEAVRSILEGDHGVLAGIAPGTIVVDLSTIQPAVSAELAERVAERNGVLLDSPVSGSLDAAEAGSLLLMVGGPGRALATARPVLEVLARRIEHVGERNGSGLALKLAVNLQVATQLVGWAEGIALAERFGVDRRTASAIMLESVIASPMLKYRVPFTLDDPDEVWANVEQLTKDVAYAEEVLDWSGPSGKFAHRLLTRTVAEGRGGREAAELVRTARAAIDEKGSDS
jgi:3-hydroxyisobutyrate dehydrogenase-like beta-hydroxyacid dehydrogenase